MEDIQAFYYKVFNGKICVSCGEKKLPEDFKIKIKSSKICNTCRTSVSKAKEKARSARQRKAHVERNRRNQRNWRTKNKDYIKAYINNKKATDPIYKLSRSIRTMICQAFKVKNMSKAKKTVEILGCDIPFFKANIESLFLPEMGWHNRDKWHIDHRIPLYAAKTESELIALNHYTNLRPLWALDNLIKGKNVIETSDNYPLKQETHCQLVA